MITRNAVKSHLVLCLKTKQKKAQPFTLSCTYNTVARLHVAAGNPRVLIFQAWALSCDTDLASVCLLLGTGLFLFCVSLTSQFSCPVLHWSSLFSLKVLYRLALAYECKSHRSAGTGGTLYTHIQAHAVVCLKISSAWLLSPSEMRQGNDCKVKKASSSLKRTFLCLVHLLKYFYSEFP